MQQLLFSKVVKFTWKIRNWLNRKKNQVSGFSDFYFLSYGHFSSKNCQLSINFHHNSENKNHQNRKIVFFHSFQHIAHHSWKWDLNWGGAVCLSLVGTEPGNFEFWSFHRKDLVLIYFYRSAIAILSILMIVSEQWHQNLSEYIQFLFKIF